MRPFQTTNPIFLLLVTLLAAGLASHAVAEIPLAWKYTGYDLMPGYRIGVTLTTPVSNYPFYHKWGTAELQAGPLKLGLYGESKFSGTVHYLRVYVNGELVAEEKVAEYGGTDGSDEVSVQLVLDIDCNGQGTVIYNNKQLASFTLQGPADISKNEVDGGKVDVYTMDSYNCDNPGDGNPPGLGGGQGDSPNPPPPKHDKLVAYALIGTGALGLGFYMLNNRGERK